MTDTVIKGLTITYTEPGGTELLRQRDLNDFFIPLAYLDRATLALLGAAIRDALVSPPAGILPPFLGKAATPASAQNQPQPANP